MPRIKFLANWRAKWHRDFNIPKGYLLVKYYDFYRKNIGKVFTQLDKFQEEKALKYPEDFIRDLEISIEFHYRKRTLDQNNLMWSLYEIEANEMNGGQSGHKDQNVTPMELYLTDLEEYGQRETINTPRVNLGRYLEEYRIIEAVILDGGKEIPIQAYLEMDYHIDDRVTFRAIKGSSKFNTKEMMQWIDRIFNRLAYHGVQVTNPGEIANYWHNWKLYLNENKITLHDTIMTQTEYKAYNPICEACGKFIQEGTGELAHIQAIGMGGDRTKEPSKNYTSNWLHLHAVPCHREHWHTEGIKKFIKRYKHLTYKVNTATKRDYAPIDDPDKLLQGELIGMNQSEEEKPVTAVDEQEKIETCDKIESCESNGEGIETCEQVESCDQIWQDESLTKEERIQKIVEKSTKEGIQQIKDLCTAGKISKSEACAHLEKIGGDPLEIDPDWPGLF